MSLISILKQHFRRMRKLFRTQKEIKDLDSVLKKCIWRMENHYSETQWEDFSHEICGSNQLNPRWIEYIKYLKEDLKLIIECKHGGDEGGFGFTATVKGLLHNGFEKQIRKDKRARILEYLKPFIGICLGWILAQYPKKDQSNILHATLESPKVQIFHDTIYLLNQKTSQDISLIRLVKLPNGPKKTTSIATGTK